MSTALHPIQQQTSNGDNKKEKNALVGVPDNFPKKVKTLTKVEKYFKVTVGIVLFFGWLLLFVLGISLKASKYYERIIPNDVLVWKYLLLYSVSLTPINVAVLASFAGALGGISSNLVAENKHPHRKDLENSLRADSADFESYIYMTENPLVSFLRGFMTYLIFIAGSYLTNFTTALDPQTTADFSGLTASSYTRFAVTVSLLAYLTGYDPSRLKGLLNNFNLTKKAEDGSKSGS